MNDWLRIYPTLWEPLAKDSDIFDHLSSVYESYVGWIKSDHHDISEIIEKSYRSILDSIKMTLLGKPDDGYRKFDAMMQDKSTLNYLRTQSITDLFPDGDDQFLFRARVGENLNERSDLFHPPFSRRCFLHSERFSIAGSPTLYLGSSVYICLLEMGQPDTHSLYLSRFHVAKSAKILDLTCDYKQYNGHATLSISDLIKFPLIYATSINIKEKSRTYHSEYIIPQYLMQYIAKNATRSIDALAYNSVQVPKSHRNALCYNLAFPALAKSMEDLKNGGYNKDLIHLLEWTNPCRYQDMIEVDPTKADIYDEDDIKMSGCLSCSPNRKKMKIAGPGRTKRLYMDTKYFAVEQYLSRLTTDTIDAVSLPK